MDANQPVDEPSQQHSADAKQPLSVEVVVDREQKRIVLQISRPIDHLFLEPRTARRLAEQLRQASHQLSEPEVAVKLKLADKWAALSHRRKRKS